MTTPNKQSEETCPHGAKDTECPVIGCANFSQDIGNWELELSTILRGIDKDNTDNKEGWWETSTGVEFGSKKLQEIKSFISNLIAQTKEEAYQEGREDEALDSTEGIQSIVEEAKAETVREILDECKDTREMGAVIDYAKSHNISLTE